jgi:hypothetical protein
LPNGKKNLEVTERFALAGQHPAQSRGRESANSWSAVICLSLNVPNLGSRAASVGLPNLTPACLGISAKFCFQHGIRFRIFEKYQENSAYIFLQLNVTKSILILITNHYDIGYSEMINEMIEIAERWSTQPNAR